MKKLRLLYLIICILLILFFCTACVFTQCSKAIAGLVFNSTSTGSDDIASGTIASPVEETNDIGVETETADTGASSDWDNSSASDNTGEAINFKIAYEFIVPGDTDSIMFTACIPSDYKYRQKIKDYGFSATPDRIFTDDGNMYAMFKLINPAEKFFLNMDIQMELFDFDLLAAQKSPGNTISGDAYKDRQLLAEYLIPERYLESDDPKIEAAADSFGNAQQLELVSSIYNFVLGCMHYSGYNPSDTGAAAALASGSGDCTEYSDLFVALCRAKGIPARVIEGYAIDAGSSDLRFGHNWTEAYLDDFGWVPFDPIYDDNNGLSPDTTFENLKNIYVYTGFKRNDAILSGYHYYSYRYYGDAIEVKKTISLN
jgi:transglutaminase/protease-like cytokinesis protein 3